MGAIGNDMWNDESVIRDEGNPMCMVFEKDVPAGGSNIDDGPVLISIPFPYVKGMPQTVHIGETSVSAITLQNMAHEPMKLWGTRILGSDPAGAFTLSLLKQTMAEFHTDEVYGCHDVYSIEGKVLHPQETLTLWLSCKPRELGLHTCILCFDVEGDRIERCAFVLAEDNVSKLIASYRIQKVPDSRTQSDLGKLKVASGYLSISTPFRFRPQYVLIGETAKCSIHLRSKISKPLELKAIRIFASNPADSFKLSLKEPSATNSDSRNASGFSGYSLEGQVLQSYETLTIWLSCNPKDIGVHTCIVYFDVGDDRIVHSAFLLAEDKVSTSLSLDSCTLGLEAGCRNPRVSQSSSILRRHRIPHSEILKDVSKLLYKEIPDVRNSQVYKDSLHLLKGGLAKNNYASFFKSLLMIEELHMQKEIQSHGMDSITLRKNKGTKYTVNVLELAEKLAKGDNVFVKLASGSSVDNTVYEAYICQLTAGAAVLKFPREFNFCHNDSMLYDIKFASISVNLRKLCQAVETAERLSPQVLFPSLLVPRRTLETSPFVPFNCSLNEEQKQCIGTILSCKGGSPYVIYGPPGTGKTLTLVEAILQIYTRRKNARILVCAATNNAADYVLDRLVSSAVSDIKDNEVFRLNARSRAYEKVEAKYVRFCYFKESEFTCPPLKALMHYRIIISTYMSSYQLLEQRINHDHFSHIFLDEAGQVTEPECMVPLATFSKKGTVTVLAGDPKQLGPLIHSKDVEARGLGKSFLERLCESENYQDDKSYVTKLVRNYRCHPKILDLPSKLFYNGKLLACKKGISTSTNSWGRLLNKDFPVLFIGIQGSTERGSNNPSWFNSIEASKVIEVVRNLKSDTGVIEADIAVITPYSQQVGKISRALEDCEMSGIQVGSVEQFQGQEREVIIISTVRSMVEHSENHSTNPLGFLSNPRRFNVAITRAKSLLVIVGNPYIINKDPYWKKLLRYCSEHNSYMGCPLPENIPFESYETGTQDPRLDY